MFSPYALDSKSSKIATELRPSAWHQSHSETLHHRAQTLAMMCEKSCIAEQLCVRSFQTHCAAKHQPVEALTRMCRKTFHCRAIRLMIDMACHIKSCVFRQSVHRQYMLGHDYESHSHVSQIHVSYSHASHYRASTVHASAKRAI